MMLPTYISRDNREISLWTQILNLREPPVNIMKCNSDPGNGLTFWRCKLKYLRTKIEDIYDSH